MHTSAGKQGIFFHPTRYTEEQDHPEPEELPAGRYSLILTVNGTRKSVQIVKPVL